MTITTGISFLRMIYALNVPLLSVTLVSSKLKFTYIDGSNYPPTRLLSVFQSLPGLSTITQFHFIVYLPNQVRIYRHKVSHYEERVIFFIRHFSSWSTLHRNALAARAACLDPRLLIKCICSPPRPMVIQIYIKFKKNGEIFEIKKL